MLMCLFVEDAVPEFSALNQLFNHIILQEFAEVGWHGEALSCQLDGGLEKFVPGQLSIQLVCAFITTEFSWYTYPFASCETNSETFNKITERENKESQSQMINVLHVLPLK